MAQDAVGGESLHKGDFGFQQQLQNQLENLMKLWGLQAQEQTPQGAVPRNTTARERVAEGLTHLWQQQMDPEAIRARAQAVAEVSEPVRFAQEQYQGRLARDPWGPGGLFAGRTAAEKYTPEEILASQGNTAENQIKRMRKSLAPEKAQALQGVVAAQRGPGEFDPEELKRVNQLYAANRSYM